MTTEKQLSFKDLDELTNLWIYETADMYDIFINQANEIKNLFFVVGSNTEKLNFINYRLNILRYLNEIFEKNLKWFISNQNCVEHLVEKLEKNTMKLEGKIPIDSARENIYCNAEQINFNLTYMKEDFTEVNNKIQEFDKGIRLSGSSEQVAKIMLTHLQYLESIETTSYRLMSMINNLRCRRNNFFQNNVPANKLKFCELLLQ